MTEEQRARLLRLQERRSAAAEVPAARPQHPARSGRILALGGSIAGTMLLVSTMWSQAAAAVTGSDSNPEAVPTTTTTRPPDRIVYVLIPRRFAPGGGGVQALPPGTVTTPERLTPAPSTGRPLVITRSHGSR